MEVQQLVIRLYFLIFVCMSPLFSWGQNAFDTLSRQQQRPSILQVAQNLNGMVMPIGIETQDELLEQIKKRLPDLVVTLESYFPNGQYFFMGRDVTLVGEALELFYHSVGQNDRVRYLKLSSSSFFGADDMLVEKFLEQNGMININRPIVILDSTSFKDEERIGSGQSQAKRVMNIIRSKHNSYGLSSEVVVRKVQVVTLMESERSVEPEWKSRTFFSRSKKAIDNFFLQTEIEENVGRQQKVLSAGFSIKDYSLAWHAKYQPLQMNQEGQVVSLQGELEDIIYRQQVLATQAKLVKIVTDREYIEKTVKDVKAIVGRSFKKVYCRNL